MRAPAARNCCARGRLLSTPGLAFADADTPLDDPGRAAAALLGVRAAAAVVVQLAEGAHPVLVVPPRPHLGQPDKQRFRSPTLRLPRRSGFCVAERHLQRFQSGNEFVNLGANFDRPRRSR